MAQSNVASRDQGVSGSRSTRSTKPFKYKEADEERGVTWIAFENGVGNNTGCENMIKNLQNQHSFFLVNMKGSAAAPPPACLANCCSGLCASLSGLWVLAAARVGIPAPD